MSNVKNVKCKICQMLDMLNVRYVKCKICHMYDMSNVWHVKWMACQIYGKLCVRKEYHINEMPYTYK